MSEKGEKGEKGLTLGDIFRTIISQKPILFALAAVITAAGTLGLYLGYNRAAVKYVAEFYINLPQDSISAAYCTLPDGTRFYYGDYVSSDVLEEVKAGGDGFSSVDIDAMVSENGISVTELHETDDDTVCESSSDRFGLSISVKSKYFKNKSVAKAFLSALAEYPVKKFLSATVDYNIYLSYSDFGNAASFDVQLGYIEKQISYLVSLYETLASVTVDESGTQVLARMQSFIAWADRVQIQNLQTEAQSNYLLKDYEREINNYLNELVLLREELSEATENLEYVLNYIAENQISGNDVASVVSSLTAEVTAIQRQINTRMNYIGAYYEYTVEDGEIVLGEVKEEQTARTQEYADKLYALFEELTGDEGFLADFGQLYKTVSSKISSVNYVKPDVVTREGGIGLFFSALISLITGLVVGSIAAYVAAGVKRRKAPIKDGADSESRKRQ